MSAGTERTGLADSMSECSLREWKEYETVEEGVELGYLCAMDGRPCEVEECQESYGEDADGNRGIWVYYKRCRKCGEES